MIMFNWLKSFVIHIWGAFFVLLLSSPLLLYLLWCVNNMWWLHNTQQRTFENLN